MVIFPHYLSDRWDSNPQNTPNHMCWIEAVEKEEAREDSKIKIYWTDAEKRMFPDAKDFSEYKTVVQGMVGRSDSTFHRLSASASSLRSPAI